MKKKFKRVYHPYHLWEEYHAGMWIVTAGEKRKEHAKASADLMRDPEAFFQAMMKAVNDWPISCEVNLTASSINQRAWLGHAGCCIAAGSPEDCTRLGWHMLTVLTSDCIIKQRNGVINTHNDTMLISSISERTISGSDTFTSPPIS